MSTLSRVALLVIGAVGALSAQGDPLVGRRDAAIQAFHDSPSLTRFSDAGVAITEASDGYPFDRPNADRLVKHREFEAMKARLAAGIVVSTATLPATSSTFSSPTPRVTLAMLPAVRTSFFRTGESLFVIALRPFKLVDEDIIAVVDALSAVNRVPMRIHMAAEPMSYGHGGSPLGAWDVRSVDARFDREALVHGVTGRGRITGYRVQAIKTPIGSQNCLDRGGSVIGTRVDADWSSSIVAWIGKPAPANATVTSRETGSTGLHNKLVTELIDLDRDGVPDFSTWAGIDKSEIVDNRDIPWKAVFVNVEGRWILGSYRSAPDCT